MSSPATISRSHHVWNAADYAANSTVQLVWARELIERLALRGDERILDVGCGDGKVSAELARRVPRGKVLGIDASTPMIEFARKAFESDPSANTAFRVMDAQRIELDERFDLVFSNAALHWVKDHQAFLRGVATCLRPGGRLVVSCGGKGNAQDVFTAVRPELRRKRWREFFRKMDASYFFYAPEDYERWLPRYGFQAARIQLVPKDAAHDGRDGFAAWLRTTWLPYTQRVPADVREEFIDAVVDRYVDAFPPDANGRVHVRMIRLEIDAIRSGT